MDIQAALKWVVEGQSLSEADMYAVMHQIMTGNATPAQIAGFLVALRMKGESVEEITGAAKVMRELVTRVEIGVKHLVDTCGTGGDGGNTFNISTASAFVAACAGSKVAKHGNRAVSGKSGSADVLEAAGIKLDLKPDQVQRCIEHIGVGFMFAPAHHSAMKHAIGPRRELGIRTLFNLLGPLTNPAGAPNQVVGVFSRHWVRPVAEVLRNLGSRHVMVVHSQDGMDEISISAPTFVAELKDGDITEFQVHPEHFGMQRASRDELLVHSVQESLVLMKAVLAGKAPQPALDVVALNAGAAIYVAGNAATLEDGIQMAQDALGSGLPLEKLNDLVSFTSVFGVEESA